MKPIFLVILTTLCMLSPTQTLHAQMSFKQAVRAAHAWKNPSAVRSFSPQISQQVTRSLLRRAQRAGFEAQTQLLTHPLAHRFLDQVSVLEIGSGISDPLRADPAQLYPNAPFLQNEDHLTLYFLSQLSRQTSQLAPQLQRQQEELANRLPQLVQAKTPISHPQEQDIAWLANQIPAETSFLLLGEAHGYPEIAFNVAKLLKELRQIQDRPIVLFTEFLPENAVWGVNTQETRLPKYAPAWEMARLMSIPTVGLEPPFVERNLRITSEFERNIWCSIEGTRLRNNRWLTLLRQAREHFPQALIVVYGGSFHMAYDWPYSLGKQLENEHPFVVTFYPTHLYRTDGNVTYATSPFDLNTNGQLAQERVLQFTDKELAKLAGFDVQLKVPLSPESYDKNALLGQKLSDL